jgi:hypothetical protein
MTPTPRGEVDDLLESEALWPERTMLRLSSAKECLATASARSTIEEPWCVTHNTPRATDETTTTRSRFTITRPYDQQQHLDTTPLLQE